VWALWLAHGIIHSPIEHRIEGFWVNLGEREKPKTIEASGKPYERNHMGEETTSLGGIHVSPNAIATIAYHATLESYGVVGLAPKNIADGIVKSITREPSRGVSVRYNGEDIDIEIHIIVEYGTRINSVAESVANTVRYHVEKAMGLKVNTVHVHVAGLRVSNPD
jgi:uncharacterized alkaline shock family protein YloU